MLHNIKYQTKIQYKRPIHTQILIQNLQTIKSMTTENLGVHKIPLNNIF